MRGYHQCTVEDAVNLAGLIYKIKNNNDRSQFVNLIKNLRDLVPEYLLRMSTQEEWKKVGDNHKFLVYISRKWTQEM